MLQDKILIFFQEGPHISELKQELIHQLPLTPPSGRTVAAHGFSSLLLPEKSSLRAVGEKRYPRSEKLGECWSGEPLTNMIDGV